MTVDAATDATALAERDDSVAPRSFARVLGRIAIYALLIAWTVVALFPIYWTLSTSMKLGRDVTQGHLIPWVDFMPSWKGWQSLGLSPDTIFNTSNVRAEFLRKFINSVICSVGASFFAIVIGSLAAYGLSRFDYKFGPWRNKDISFFFVSQLILPPVVLALPFLVLYKGLALLDTRIGLILIYTLMVLPIVIWVMRDQFDTIPMEMEQAALVHDLGRLPTHCAPDRAAWHGRGLHPVARPLLERVLLRLPPERVRRADPARHGGEPDGLVRHQLVDNRCARDGGHRAASADRDFPRTLHRHGAYGRSGQIARGHARRP
jgi:ABC-type glycerol-3-phosphate transport system permease component